MLSVGRPQQIRSRAASLAVCIALPCFAGGGSAGCTTKEPQSSTYFDRTIAPILQTSCVRTNTGAACHVADDHGNAFGNLDLSNYSGVSRRRDLLLEYGPYLQPSMLAKNVAPYQVGVALWDGTKIAVTTDIKHAGLAILDPTAGAYQTLRRWIDNGATENNSGVAPTVIAQQACNALVPSAPGFDPNVDPTGSDFATFELVAEPVLGTSCAAGNCHGTSVNALYLTCGQTRPQIRWNYFAVADYLAATAEESEIVRRPLATSQGGSYHEGGPLFTSVQDPGYAALVKWAKMHGPPQPPTLDPAFVFFAQVVQPILVKKGCMMAQCHSAAMFHDYRLRGGSAGSFSLAATRKNYALTVAQMSFESDDVGASRLVRKNLYRPEVFPGSNGIAHRGGPLFEDFGSRMGDGGTGGSPGGGICDQANYSYDKDHVDALPAYCVIREWHRRERAERNLTGVSVVVYVSRPPPPLPDRPQDFDVFAPGASLHIAMVATASATGDLTLVSDRAVDLSACGLGSAPDVRRPAVSWDAKILAFAARPSADVPLAIYTANVDGTGCAKQPDIAGHDAVGNGLLEHDFDPAFSPPGPDGIERIVFASTRGNLDLAGFDYAGPQRTPADPGKANANLYVLEPDSNKTGNNHIRQLTWQLNMERLPTFMEDGRLIFTAEKREPGFYQLALRRQNLDGGDYHPLYAQRASIGYEQATGAVELSYKDFAAIFSNQDAKHGAGVLAVFNRSIGVDFSNRDPSAYPVDPTVVQAASRSAPEEDFFLHSLRIVATDGSYVTPAALPDGKVLVSYGAGDPASFGGDYDIYVLDPITGAKTMLVGNPGTAEVEAVAVYPRAVGGIFSSMPDEPNGATHLESGVSTADVTVLDMPVLASLLFQNTPTGRLVEPDLKSFEIYEELPPDAPSFTACGHNTVCDAFGMVYVRRRPIGTVAISPDGSAHFVIPGGMPILLHLADDTESGRLHLPRWQRETMTFLPGEHARQSFPRRFFDNLCAGCHGSISGHPLDAALSPDFLTQASAVQAVTAGCGSHGTARQTRACRGPSGAPLRIVRPLCGVGT